MFLLNGEESELQMTGISPRETEAFIVRAVVALGTENESILQKKVLRAADTYDCQPDFQ
jgi:hypothetical protein